ncbi:MAG: inorganic pyrophosphatase [Polyangiales bacterium]
MKTFFERYRPHPWHGLSVGPSAPDVVHAYIEITPFDTIKWEIDKESGYLKVDRPQLSASLPPTLYGFVPRTYCGDRVARLAGVERGDGDPLDICVISERPINRSDVLLCARPVGGLLMIDGGEADDKIIAVLDKDPVWSAARDLADLPPALVDRLRHYFVTYKLKPGSGEQPVDIARVYGRDDAARVLAASVEDYVERFGG